MEDELIRKAVTINVEVATIVMVRKPRKRKAVEKSQPKNQMGNLTAKENIVNI